MSQGIGTQLRDARLARGLEVGDIADALKIRRSHVVAMESENFAALGASPYVRGHLRNYAREVGLDPEQIVGAWDREHGGLAVGAHDIAATTSVSASRPREPLPRWIVVTGLLVVVLGALALIGSLGNRTPDTGDTVVSSTVAPTATSTPTAPSNAPTSQPAGTPAPAATPTPTPIPTPTPDGVELLLAFEQDVWMAIDVDGAPHPKSQTVFRAGAVLTIQGDQVVEIRYGNAGGVDVELNGERLGTPGASGQVVNVTYTVDGPTVAA